MQALARTISAIMILVFLCMPTVRADTSEPLVIVVHGIGGGNRDDGWSQDVAKRWSVQTQEVTFRMEGRTWGTSFVDFARNGGDWARDAQNQIKGIVQKNPGRRVIIVAHSWGTVVTKLALGGGVASGLTLPAIDLGGVEVDELVTLGSPLGRAESPDVAGICASSTWYWMSMAGLRSSSTGPIFSTPTTRYLTNRTIWPAPTTSRWKVRAHGGMSAA